MNKPTTQRLTHLYQRKHAALEAFQKSLRVTSRNFPADI